MGAQFRWRLPGLESVWPSNPGYETLAAGAARVLLLAIALTRDASHAQATAKPDNHHCDRIRQQETAGRKTAGGKWINLEFAARIAPARPDRQEEIA